MPSHDQKPQHSHGLPASLAAALQQAQPDLASQVAALREEIAALRHDLKPLPSLILTGQQVVAEFKRMQEVGAIAVCV